jgi:predicted O-methyltransferase YrrM
VLAGRTTHELELKIPNDKTWSAIDAYFEGELIPADPAFQALLEACATAGLPSIQVSAAQGKFLHLLALAQAPKRILEIGTLGGYSTLWLARALPRDGRLLTLEINAEHAAVARRNFVEAGVSDLIEIQVGPALDTLARLRAQKTTAFDFVFIDADKINNLGYMREALALSRVGTLIIVDNVVRAGAILDEERDAAADGVRRMTAWVGQEPRLSATVIQTVGDKGYDGFLLARVG